MASCPKSTLYKRWTSKRRVHIKSHRMFYIPPVTRVILPSPGISSQPFYLPLLEGKFPPCVLLAKPLSAVWSQQKEPPRHQKTTFGGQIKLQLAHLMARLLWEGRMWQMHRKHCLGKRSPAALHQCSAPSPFPRSQWENLFSLFVLISLNKNNEFLKPCKNVTRCQQSQPGRWCMARGLQLP